MAIRVIYILNNKSPDVIPEAESWLFRDGTLRILSGRHGAPGTKLLVEIREDYVLAVEHVELEDDAKKAPEEPEKAPEKPKKPRKRTKKA